MTQGNFINLKIDRSLSYTIDTQLKKELNKDVCLNLKQWQSVFNIVKNDTATTKPQYNGGDTDINNGKNFIVQKGQIYNLTQNAWNEIKKIALQALGSTTQTQETQSAQEQPAGQTASTAMQTAATTPETSNTTNIDFAKAQVEEILKKCEIDTSDIDVNDVVNKYKTILDYNNKNGITTNQTVLENRIVNYAKGLKAHAQETRFADAWQAGITCDTKLENEAVTTALQHQSQEEFNAAFHQAAKEYIELYDSADGDGKIDVNEFIRMEAKEQGRKLTSDEIKMLQQESVDRVAILDQNNDGKLDEDEIAAYLWAMSKINDGKEGKTADDITFDEWKTAQEAMGILSGTQPLTKENRMKTMNANTIIAKLKSQYGDIKLEDLYGADLSTYTNLTENEREQLRAGLEIYENEGFKQEMIDQYTKFDFALKNGYEGLKRK